MKNICQFGVMRVSIWLFSDLIIEKSIWKYNITLHFRLTNMLKIKDLEAIKPRALCCCFVCHDSFEYVDYGHTGTLVADIWKWFSIFYKMINTWLKFKLNSRTDSKCKTMFHKYSYGSDLGFPRLVLLFRPHCWFEEFEESNDQ